MDRLTIRNSDGTVSQPTRTGVDAVFDRLADYEDIGMTPEEILSMKYTLAQLHLEADPLLLAKMDGRLFLLPERCPKGLGPMLKKKRKQAGLTQAEVGALVGVTGGIVSYWERGSRNPRAAHLQAILAALDEIDPDVKWTGEKKWSQS